MPVLSHSSPSYGVTSRSSASSPIYDVLAVIRRAVCLACLEPVGGLPPAAPAPAAALWKIRPEFTLGGREAPALPVCPGPADRASCGAALTTGDSLPPPVAEALLIGGSYGRHDGRFRVQGGEQVHV